MSPVNFNSLAVTSLVRVINDSEKPHDLAAFAAIDFLHRKKLPISQLYLSHYLQLLGGWDAAFDLSKAFFKAIELLDNKELWIYEQCKTS